MFTSQNATLVAASASLRINLHACCGRGAYPSVHRRPASEPASSVTRAMVQSVAMRALHFICMFAKSLSASEPFLSRNTFFVVHFQPTDPKVRSSASAGSPSTIRITGATSGMTRRYCTLACSTSRHLAQQRRSNGSEVPRTNHNATHQHTADRHTTHHTHHTPYSKPFKHSKHAKHPTRVTRYQQQV